MRFHPKRKRLKKWKRWFAWHPIQVGEPPVWTWLEWVWRRDIGQKYHWYVYKWKEHGWVCKEENVVIEKVLSTSSRGKA